jgi:eukaryotic-like serine/threonine-protein kinase
VNAERWQRLQELFHAAIPLGTPERERVLSEACGEDAALRMEVDRLLAAHERPGGIIESPIAPLDSSIGEDEVSAVGKRFGPYRVVREIGRGGMGSVYLGERADGQFEQQVAIKVIRRGMDTAQVLARFRAERRILASLEHPNIARLLDGGTSEDGQPYFIMEYIDGQPIDVYADARTLTVVQRLELFLQVASAVTYAHQHLIVHRDIKPLNVLVTSEGVPKLLDFGIAKVLHADAEESTSTVTGWRLLTPEYASPEQVAGLHATTVSDVYSLGVVLYELLTGVSPYRLRDRTPQDIAQAVSSTEPLRPSSAVSGAGATGRRRAGVVADRAAATGSVSTERLQRRLRGDLDTIVLTALRKEPQRRYQSVEQFAGDIRRHLDGLPVGARPDTLRYRVGKFVRRNRVPVAAAVLVALALVGGTVTTAWQARQARAAQARAERRFNDVRKLANTVLFDYHDAIKDLRGATPVRERLVRDALGYLDGLASEHSDDPSLQRELASAYRRVGDVQGGDPKGLGDTKGALESYTKALGMLEALFRADSNDVRTRRDLAEVALAVGAMVWERGDLPAGLAHARRARGILEPLVALSPQDTDQGLKLHKALDLLGQMSLEAGEVTQALEFYRADLKQLEQVPQGERRRRDVRRAISVTYGHMADAQVDRGDLAGALESHRRSLDLRNELAAESPDNADYEYLVQQSRYYMANVLGRMGRWGEALRLLQRNLGESPKSAFTEFRVGEALIQLGRPAEALGHFRRALQFHKQEVGADSASLFNRLALAMDQSGICKASAVLGRAEAPAACARTAAFVIATPVEPTHAFPRAHMGGIWFELGEAYESLADHSKTPTAERSKHRIAARNMYQRSLEIWSDLTARKLISPIDTHRVEMSDRAVKRIEAVLQDE